MELTIKPGAATDDARQIETIVSGISDDMDELNRVFRDIIPEEINTSWSDTLLSNWNTYYQADIPEAMENMEYSATNLQLAVEKALAYDQESD